MTDLIQGGFVQVPRIPTKAMLDAACQAMRHRQETMGQDWVPVSNKVKACIRWEAMLAALGGGAARAANGGARDDSTRLPRSVRQSPDGRRLCTPASPPGDAP